MLKPQGLVQLKLTRRPMYASRGSTLTPEAVPQQYTQGASTQTRPAAAAARATSRVGVRVRTAVNTAPICATPRAA